MSAGEGCEWWACHCPEPVAKHLCERHWGIAVVGSEAPYLPKLTATLREIVRLTEIAYAGEDPQRRMIHRMAWEALVKVGGTVPGEVGQEEGTR